MKDLYFHLMLHPVLFLIFSNKHVDMMRHMRKRLAKLPKFVSARDDDYLVVFPPFNPCDIFFHHFKTHLNFARKTDTKQKAR